MKKIAGLILKELLVQIILSTVLVVILAFIVFKLSLGDGIIRIMILAIYGICSLIGGLILGKKYTKEKVFVGACCGSNLYRVNYGYFLYDKGRNRRWSNWTWHRSSSSFRLWNFWWNAWVNSMKETDHRI